VRQEEKSLRTKISRREENDFREKANGFTRFSNHYKWSGLGKETPAPDKLGEGKENVTIKSNGRRTRLNRVKRGSDFPRKFRFKLLGRREAIHVD